MINEIADRIDVLAAFDGKGLQPRIFIWRKRRHAISRITASWTEPAGAHRLYYFAAQTDGANIYELRFDQGKMLWLLMRIHTEG